MDAHDRSCDSGSQPYPLRGVGNTAEHTPDKGAIPLPGHPGMKVVGDQEKSKSNAFSHLGMSD
jgi:hypothetical protein